jgi:hypothetical protein
LGVANRPHLFCGCAGLRTAHLLDTIQTIENIHSCRRAGEDKTRGVGRMADGIRLCDEPSERISKNYRTADPKLIA